MKISGYLRHPKNVMMALKAIPHWNSKNVSRGVLLR
jgi:hypothetical protein